MNAKINRLAVQISDEIEKGEFGESGAQFITTRALADRYNISLEYSNGVMKALENKKLLTLLGKHYYLTYKKAGLCTPFYDKYAPKKKFGMIISSLDNLFIARLSQEVADEAAKTDYSLSFMLNGDITDIFESFTQEKVSGIFVDPFIAKNNAGFLKLSPIPVVSLGYDLSGMGIDSITVDNFSAGEAIGEHLIQTGCGDFAYVGFLRNDKTDERLNGFCSAINKRGFALQDDKTILIKRDAFGKYDVDELFSEIKKLVWRTSAFNKIGIFCYHDLLAYDVISAIKNMDTSILDRKIAKDIAIVGFDNLFITPAISPNLTTVSYPTREMAQKAIAAMLDATINPTHGVVKKLVEFSIIERKTTRE